MFFVQCNNATIKSSCIIRQSSFEAAAILILLQLLLLCNTSSEATFASEARAMAKRKAKGAKATVTNLDLKICKVCNLHANFQVIY